MIFPTGWQEPKTANNLGKMNQAEVKEDKQIVFIDNRHNAFPAVPGAEWTNIILWKRGYDNGLNGQQRILLDGEDAEVKRLLLNKNDVEKPREIEELKRIVETSNDFESMVSSTSVRKPYGLSTDVLDDPSKYGLPPIFDTKQADTDIVIYGLKNRKQSKCYLPLSYPIPKTTDAFHKYKILIGKAWGNFSDSYLGGAYADIIIASPNEICTENYLESGCFDDYETAQKHAKYLYTKFCRALLYANKYSQDNSKIKWASVPVQTYEEEWWNQSINEIDNELFKKYNIPATIQSYVEANVQTKSESNIINYREVNEHGD